MDLQFFGCLSDDLKTTENPKTHQVGFFIKRKENSLNPTGFDFLKPGFLKP